MSKLKFGSPAFRAKYLGHGKKSRSRAVRHRSKTRSVSMARRKGGYRGSSSGSGMNVAIGAAILSFVAPKVAILNNPLVQAAGGYFLSKKGGMMGGVGTAAMAIGVSRLASSSSLSGAVSSASGAGELF